MAIISDTGRLDWRALPRAAQSYVVVVIAAGVCALLAYAPPLSAPPPMFLALLAASFLTSIWKVNLPIALASGATLSVSYAAHLTALGDNRLGSNFVDLLGGIKVRVAENSVLAGAVNVPLNDEGFRATAVGTLALEQYF